MSNAKFIITGDMKRGAETLPVAVNFLKQARAIGQTQLNKTFFFGDIKVRVVLNPYTGDRVFIDIAECPLVAVSGFLDTFKTPALRRWVIDQQLAEEYRDAFDQNGEPYPAKLLCGIQPVNKDSKLVDGTYGVADPIDTQGTDNDLYMTDAGSTVWRKENGAWRKLTAQNQKNNPLLITKLPVEETSISFDENGDSTLNVVHSLFKETFEKLIPSRFSGFMRRVVQATFATSAWVGFAPNQDGVIKSPVNYKFGDSWGCIKKGGKYFFVQITLDAAYSVPADYCIHKIKTSEGVFQDVVILKSLRSAEKVLLVNIPPGLGVSWDPMTGWAFSYDSVSPEASIVVYKNSYYGANSFRVTSLLTVAFKFSPETGELFSAEFSQTKYEFFFAPVGMTGRSPSDRSLLNIVTDLGELGGGIQNVTFNFGREDPNQTGPYATDTPVYVFYRETDGIQLVTYTYQNVAPYSATVAAKPTTVGYDSYGNVVDDYSDRLQQGWVGSKSESGGEKYGFIFRGESPSFKGNKNDSYSEWTYKLNLPDTITTGDSLHITWTADLRVHYPGDPTADPPVPPTDYVYDHISGTVSSTLGNVVVGQAQVSESGGGEIVRNAVVFSTNDREAVIIYSETTKSAESTHTVTTPLSYKDYVSGATYGAYGSNSSGQEDAQLIARLRGGTFGIPCGGVSVENYNEQWFLSSEPKGFLAGGTSVTVSPSSFTLGDNPPTSCGVISQFRNNANTVVPMPAVTDISDAKAPIGTSMLTVYGAGDPVSLTGRITGYGDIMNSVHPTITPLVFWFSQGAFDPSNYFTHSKHLNGAAFVRIGKEEYDVRHSLNGWIGVA